MATAAGVTAAVSIGTHAVAQPVAVPVDPYWTQLRGFNYQPSYGSTGLELWLNFDATVIERELAAGKKHFPGMNGLRWWLSRDAFLRNPQRFADNFETALQLADKIGCKVMPVLFNRWHSPVLDYGGIYVDHFYPRASWVQRGAKMFESYLQMIVGGHKDDPRIVAWDLCNEPFSYRCKPEEMSDIDKAELAWLTELYGKCKTLGATAPLTIGTHSGIALSKIEPISDILSIHPYFVGGHKSYESQLDADASFAQRVKKPLVATECCWGSLDDKKRVDAARYTFKQLKARNIGWYAYLLHHSLIADAHRPEFGPTGWPGNLAFIEADGSLRPGHHVFNEF